ncbi:hypothetical protein FPV67DRAFT_1557445 [Lyophyllum atratum]|nr:hypothetical protein FPV67DRAFT_1557445 [Lyophyllum atratum]
MVSSADVQRLFLQAIFSRGVLSEKLAQTLWEKSVAAVKGVPLFMNLSTTVPSDNAWDAFVTKVNRSLDSLDLEFRHLHDENSGTEMYALVSDLERLFSSDHTTLLIELIMLAPRESFSVSSTAALREVGAIKPKINMSKMQAEIVLGSFVAKGWLVKSKRGRYSLSTTSTYPDEIIECTICMEILTRGIACQTNNCKTRLHYHCFATFRRRQNTCPSCSIAWPATHTEAPLIPVGEGAARDGDDVKRRARSEASDDEEEPTDEEEPRGTKSQQKRSQRARKGKAAQHETMDVDDDEFEDEPVKTEKASQPTRRSSRK